MLHQQLPNHLLRLHILLPQILYLLRNILAAANNLHQIPSGAEQLTVNFRNFRNPRSHFLHAFPILCFCIIPPGGNSSQCIF